MKNGAAEVSLVKLLQNHVSVAKCLSKKLLQPHSSEYTSNQKWLVPYFIQVGLLLASRVFFWNTLLATLLNSEQPTGLPLGFQKLPTENADIKMH